MTLRRYTVEVVRHERQTVTFTADDKDMDGSDMQRAVAHAYAKHHAWVRDSGLEISSLSADDLDEPYPKSEAAEPDDLDTFLEEERKDPEFIKAYNEAAARSRYPSSKDRSS